MKHLRKVLALEEQAGDCRLGRALTVNAYIRNCISIFCIAIPFDSGMVCDQATNDGIRTIRACRASLLLSGSVNVVLGRPKRAMPKEFGDLRRRRAVLGEPRGEH